MLKEYVVVDLEMTGLKPARDKILEIGAVHIKDGKFVGEYQTMVNPMMVIPENITALTGITQEMSDAGADTKEAVAEFLKFAGDLPLIGHNIIYDYGFLKHNAVNYDLVLEAEVLDTLKLSRKLLPDLEKKSLEALCSHFQLVREQEHRALDDAKVTAQLFELLQAQFACSQPELFEPKPIIYKVKKQGPITPRQKKYLKELVDYHKIDLPVSIESMTRSEASRMTDKILAQYGKAKIPSVHLK